MHVFDAAAVNQLFDILSYLIKNFSSPNCALAPGDYNLRID